jgi:hypothetical protein
MFTGEARGSIATDMGEEEFHEKVREALEPLGDVDVDDGGNIAITPKSTLVSFMATPTISGKVKSSDDGYKVDIDYSVAPSTVMWVLTVAAFCIIFPFGAAVIILPMLLDKPAVQTAAEKAIRELKDATSTKKKSKSKSKASDDDDDD